MIEPAGWLGLPFVLSCLAGKEELPFLVFPRLVLPCFVRVFPSTRSVERMIVADVFACPRDPPQVFESNRVLGLGLGLGLGVTVTVTVTVRG